MPAEQVTPEPAAASAVDTDPGAGTVAGAVRIAYPSSGPLRRGGLLVRLGVSVAAVLVLLGGSAAMAVDRVWPSAARSELTVGPRAAPDAGRGDLAPAPVAPPAAAGAHDPGQVVPGQLRSGLQTTLNAQAAALLRGDETAFLAPADPDNVALLGDLRRRFGVLRAMKVVSWTETLADDLEPVDGGWQVGVRLGYCFVVAGCKQVVVPVATRWVQTGGSPVLVEFGSSGSTDLGPRPWEVSELMVAIGRRTMVAAPPKYAGRLPALLSAAENAAAVSDRYARWAPAPGRYVVYLAGPDEWGDWYGVHQAAWVAGYAMPLTEYDTEIVLNAQRVTGGEVEDTLRHEFAHVVTLAGAHRDTSAQWWLLEGIAEYVRMVGRPLREYELLPAARRYARAGSRTDLSGLGEPAAGASADDASGRYGVAFLTVRRLAERFGEDRMLRFFADVVRQGIPQEQAAGTEFGADWNEITADCARYVKRNLN
jgi:hypothetical protein